MPTARSSAPRIRTLDDERPAATARRLARRRDRRGRRRRRRASEHIGPRTRVIDGRGMAVVPGLIDSHIHPFWGTIRRAGSTCGRRATLEEVRGAARRRAARAAGRGSGCSATARATSRSTRRAARRRDRRGDAATRRRSSDFFDGAHRAGLARRAARCAGVDRRARVRASARRSSSTRTGGRPARCSRTRAMDLVRAVVPDWTEAETPRRVRRDAAARSTAVGLTGAHVMVGDPELLDDVPRRSRRAAT